MDATKKPVKIPPEFGIYADKHGIFDLYKRILSELLILKPDDPLSYIAEYLTREDDDVPQVMILGPSESGKNTISRMLSNAIGAVRLTADSIWNDPEVMEEKNRLEMYGEEVADLNPSNWAQLVKFRLKKPDVIKNGWILVGLPETREQQKAFCELGIFPKHCVILDAPDSFLMDRLEGKRVDPVTGESYHLTYDFPTDETIAARLVRPTMMDSETAVKILIERRRDLDSVLHQYKHMSLTVNADQPKTDIFSQVMKYICDREGSCAPRTPRIILIGPPGSGRHTVVQRDLAKRYSIVNVDVDHLIKEAIAAETDIGLNLAIELENSGHISDELMIELLTNRLSQRDCNIKGWILIGFPLTLAQAELLSKAGFTPNRVIVLDISSESLTERVTLRRTDPMTGSRHHLLTNPPRTVSAGKRSLTHPNDEESVFKSRVEEYYTNIKDVEDFYAGLVQHVNADQEKVNVGETVESIIVKPQAKCSA